MKKKKLNQNLDADFPEEDNELPQKGIERTTVYLIIIFSLTFFILGNATGFLLLKNAKTGIFLDESFYAVSEKESSSSENAAYGDDSSESSANDISLLSDSEISNQEEISSGYSGAIEDVNPAGVFEEQYTVTPRQSEEQVFDGEHVYITPSGKKYHYSPSCGGENAFETTLEEALAEGKTPCKKCVK